MTDYQKFLTLYKSVGIESNESSFPNDRETERGEQRPTYILTITEGQNKVGGYSDFFTELLFDSEGKFLKQNIWE